MKYILLLLALFVYTTPAFPAPAYFDCHGIARAKDGRIYRNTAVIRKFKFITGYPHGRTGYVVDHIVPLQCGGQDKFSNLQWQTIAAAKAKDKIENQCRPVVCRV